MIDSDLLDDLMTHLSKIRDTMVCVCVTTSMENPLNQSVRNMEWVIEQIHYMANAITRYEVENHLPITVINDIRDNA